MEYKKTDNIEGENIMTDTRGEVRMREKRQGKVEQWV